MPINLGMAKSWWTGIGQFAAAYYTLGARVCDTPQLLPLSASFAIQARSPEGVLRR